LSDAGTDGLTAIARDGQSQLDSANRRHEPIYGDGRAGERIAAILSGVEVTLQKRITY